jgi:RND family efflux transporter MFP subunit
MRTILPLHAALRVGSLFAGALLLTVFVGCKKGGDPRTTPSKSTLVHVQVIEEAKRPVLEEVVGSVRAKSSATVEAKVSGRVSKMLVDLGQRVVKDQLLAEIDAQEVKAQYDRAVANRDQMARDFKRYAELLQKQVTSHQEYDAAQGRYLVADAAVKEAETMLGYVQVRAPFAGVITRKIADVGDFSTPGKPLLQLENPEQLRFEADVPEAIIDAVHTGNPVDVLVTTLGGKIHGTISEISPTADPSSRTYLTRIDLPMTTGLRAGQFGRAYIPVGESLSVSVPASALLQRGQMEIVFVNDRGIARLRLVKSGKHYEDGVEILSGLSKGEEVICDMAQSLRDGQPIQIAR